MPPPIQAVTRPTPALQQVLRLLVHNPYAVAVTVPREGAEPRIRRILARYPTTAAHRNTRSALRGLDLPTVTALVMPPDPASVTLLLFTNVPPDSAEAWRLATDPAHPLTWRNYEVARVPDVQVEADKLRRPQPPKKADRHRLTWRLSRAARAQYRTQITRTIHSSRSGTGQGGPRAGTTRTPAGQRAVLNRLGAHLGNYPGLHGVRVDVWMLGVHTGRLWRQQHQGQPAPTWPRVPYCRRDAVTLAPLTDLWPDATQETP